MDDIKLIAFDLDGTLLRTDKTLSPRVFKALNLAAERGIELVPASGRSFAGIPAELKAMPGVNYIITSNGAAVYNPEGVPVYEDALPREMAAEIISKAASRRTVPGAYIDGKGYMEHKGLITATEIGIHPAIVNYFRSTRVFVDNICEFISGQEHLVHMITLGVSPSDADTHNRIMNTVKQFSGVSCVYGSPSDIDVNSDSAAKGTALLKIADIIGIDAAHIAAMGDSGNDETMLRAAGLGIAMANGSEAVKARAKMIVPSNDEDGAAEAIEKILGMSD